MKNTRKLLTLLMSLLLIVALTGCAAAEKGETAPKIDETKAIDLVWGYEMHLIEAVKNADPTKFVTGLEKQWLEERQAKKAAGEQVRLGWTTGGAVIALTKATEREAEVKVQYEDSKAGRQTVTFLLKPVSGEWKIANHTTPDGKWWAPAKK
ncbi:MAG: hypothetical protein ACOY94_20830 [Bacillota bacterium]